ncbi:hypothetical protein C8Q74DRAFT_1311486, partial [Fomes fomentarius]
MGRLRNFLKCAGCKTALTACRNQGVRVCRLDTGRTGQFVEADTGILRYLLSGFLLSV